MVVAGQIERNSNKVYRIKGTDKFDSGKIVLIDRTITIPKFNYIVSFDTKDVIELAKVFIIKKVISFTDYNSIELSVKEDKFPIVKVFRYLNGGDNLDSLDIFGTKYADIEVKATQYKYYDTHNNGWGRISYSYRVDKDTENYLHEIHQKAKQL